MCFLDYCILALHSALRMCQMNMKRAICLTTQSGPNWNAEKRALANQLRDVVHSWQIIKRILVLRSALPPLQRMRVCIIPCGNNKEMKKSGERVGGLEKMKKWFINFWKLQCKSIEDIKRIACSVETTQKDYFCCSLHLWRALLLVSVHCSAVWTQTVQSSSLPSILRLFSMKRLQKCSTPNGRQTC